MPYIPVVERSTPPAKTPGQLAYVITKEVAGFVWDTGISFARLAEALGVLEAVKQEIYRRVIAPYEDMKIAENGDVPELGELQDAIRKLT